MGASSQISANTHFHQHVSILCRKAGARLRILQRLSSYIDEHYRMTIFRSFVLINYCSLVWNFCEAAHTSKMERIQFRALKYIYITMMLAPAMKNCLPVPTYQPWNCTVKGKLLWKFSNLLTFHHIFYVGLVQSKRREL